MKEPRVAVITPYFKESLDVLIKCHESVKNQAVDVEHFFIADGFPNSELDVLGVRHIILDKAHGDNGNTPRGIGALLAEIEGFEYIAYLDADNWFHPGHLDSLISLQKETQADVCCSFRTIHDLDGNELTNVQDKDELSLNHVDTSCFLLHRFAFESSRIWLNMPRQLSPLCDRVFYAGLRHYRYRIAHTKQKTVAFRSQYLPHYEAAGAPLAENLKSGVEVEPLQWLYSFEGTVATVERLKFWPFWLP